MTQEYLGLCLATPFSWTFDVRAGAVVAEVSSQFLRNLHICDWFRTDESQEENCYRGKREGWGKITIKTKIIMTKINK